MISHFRKALFALAACATFTGAAKADIIFSDTIVINTNLIEGQSTSFTHIISDDVDLAMFNVMAANLVLNFQDQVSNNNGVTTQESISIDLASFLQNITNVPNSGLLVPYTFDLGSISADLIFQLNTIGQLAVTVSVLNDGRPNTTQDIRLVNSTLGGTATPTTVPEPMSLALFGSGLLGLGLTTRRRSKKADAADATSITTAV